VVGQAAQTFQTYRAESSGGPERPAVTSGTERAMAEALAEVVGVARVGVDDHFFADLGADSVLMTRFCARVRERGDLPAVSIEDAYRHPTIRGLARALAGDAPAPAASPAPAQESRGVLMPVISSVHEFNENELYVDLRSIVGQPLFLKCEGFNFAGSVKLKAAAAMVEAAERDGILRQGAFLVESSSGNLGVALSMIAASNGYRFVCVTDSRCNLAARRLMEALGAQVHVITQPDPVDGLVGARMNYVRQLCASDERYVWLNQYANPNAWKVHYQTTAPAIAREFPQLDVLFVGAGTAGTLMGCARYFREFHPRVRIVAVDPVGSVSFGTPPARRMIPGLGMGVRPPLLDESYVDEVVHVEEPDAIRTCHRLARRGFLFGGSTGTVVSGATDWLARHGTGELIVVALAPDLGERYLDTIYQTNWVTDLYGEDVLVPDVGRPVGPDPMPDVLVSTSRR
jgi:2,3-diaminopropionate biosynthesis protein SbnA